MRISTVKKSALLGLVFSGISVLFFLTLIWAIQWQQGRSPEHRDLGFVFAAAFGVPFVCCGVAAVLSFLVSAVLIVYNRFFGSRQTFDCQSVPSPLPQRRKVRYPTIVTSAGLAVLIVSVQFGTAAVFLLGFPVLLIACAIAGGARSPAKIPLRDAVLYVAISVAIVIAIAVYGVYGH